MTKQTYFILLDFSYHFKYAVEDLGGSGRAAVDIGVYRKDIADTTEGRVAAAEDAAVMPAVTDGDDELGRRHGVIGPP